MYKIIVQKRGKINNKNVFCLNFTKYPSKHVECLLAKKVVNANPIIFALSKKRNLHDNIFYKLSHSTEFNNIRTEFYLTLTGSLFVRSKNKLYKKSKSYNFKFT